MVSLFYAINLGWMFMTPVYGTSGGISSTFVGFRIHHPLQKKSLRLLLTTYHLSEGYSSTFIGF
jgi:hypothetical protein